MVESFINDVYHIDSVSPGELQVSGSMRLAMHAALASQFMHYEARVAAKEANEVCDILLRAVGIRLGSQRSSSSVQSAPTSSSSSSSSSSAGADSAGGLVLVGISAHTTICAYGAAVRKQFDEANLHLTSHASSEGVERLASSAWRRARGGRGQHSFGRAARNVE